MEESGTPDFWPDTLGFATLTAVLGALFTVISGYFRFWLIAVLILDRTKLSELAQIRWLLGPSLAVLVLTNQHKDLPLYNCGH